MIDETIESRRRKWVEPLVALLMALTTVATAWCSYESAAWTRKANGFLNEANALERRAALLEVQGSQALVVHASMFMQLLAAQHAGNEKLAAFYAERFPPDVKQAYAAWIAQNPFGNPSADAHPFVPELYQVRGAAEAANQRSTSAQLIVQSRASGDRSGQYLASTVLFATVLFFAGTAGKFEQPRVRLTSVVFATILFLFAVIRTLLLPIS